MDYFEETENHLLLFSRKLPQRNQATNVTLQDPNNFKTRRSYSMKGCIG